MEQSLFNQKVALSILLASGWPANIAKPLLCEFASLIRNHGPEWAVSRIKQLKAVYLHRIGGTTRNHDEERGIRFHKDGTPYGAFRPLFRCNDRKSVAKALNALMIYSGVKLPRVTAAQWKKFRSSVAGSPGTTEGIGVEISPELRWSFRDAWKRSRYIPLERWMTGGKRAPIMGRTRVYNKPEEDSYIHEHLHTLLSGPFEQDLLGRFPTPFEKSCGVKVPRVFKDRVSRSERPCPAGIVGTIGLIQERGAKCRAIANPMRVYQAALSRLGSALFEFLRTSCPWDCTFDQSRGVRRVQSWLGMGKTVHSVDLSDATNEFPLDLQETVVHALFGQTDAEFTETMGLFHSICTAKWLVPNEAKTVTSEFAIRWMKGQPLGLYPSFAAFAVTHGLLLRTIEESLGLENTFVVLGDDVAICDDSVHAMYLGHLQSMGCPVSKMKSISSKKVAEFAGRIVLDSGVLRVEKWKGFCSADPLAVVRHLGMGAIKYMVPPRVREEVLYFASLPEPVGVGLNPRGKPLAERLEGLTELYEPSFDLLTEPTGRLLERVRDASEAFGADFVDSYSRSTRHQLSMVLSWHGHRFANSDPDLLRWVKHWNENASALSAYDVSPLLLQLRDNLVPFVPPERGTYKVPGKDPKSRLSSIISLVRRVLRKE